MVPHPTDDVAGATRITPTPCEAKSPHLMLSTNPLRKILMLLAAAGCLALSACAADRPARQSIEPDWSHHDDPAELTAANKEVWDKYAASRFIGDPRSAQVAQVPQTQEH